VFFFLQSNHLVGIKRTLLKLTFVNVQNLLAVRKVIFPIINRNQSRQEADGAYNDLHEYESKLNPLCGFGLCKTNINVNYRLEAAGPITSKKTSDPQDCLIELREYDVQYYVRTAIDCGG
jgi:DNA polymerase epsilon subunit 1